MGRLPKFNTENKDLGGFQLEFVSISRVINHMTCYKFECSHWWKIYLKKNPLPDLLSSLNAVISTNESTQIIRGHVIYNLSNLQIPTENHPYLAINSKWYDHYCHYQVPD